MKWVYDDGGRKAAGFKGDASDCVCRAIAIADQRPYEEVYELINLYGIKERKTKRRTKGKSTARNGVYKSTTKKILTDFGWKWNPTMYVGSGCVIHLRGEELPKGRIIASVSRHLVAVVDGVIHDTHDCSRGGTRCVYGYWTKE